MEEYTPPPAKPEMRELDFNELNTVSGGNLLRSLWTIINLFLLHPSHTSKDEHER